ncbi:unnamed protein product [Spirodela intermedia]|uniref:Reverse transcriptase domain-containing protein n=1 Tax=Spirodela intermedia TaxID=51605 RepID=A0ABN7EBU1_SPIIN|nr:unnamed protein product [Spirodela intermedia]
MSAINICPYHYLHNQKTEIGHLIQQMCIEGIIQPSFSPFFIPIIIIKKKIRVVDELLDDLHDATIFFKLNLKSDYHPICMKVSDVQKITFHTHLGHYEFLVMSFNLTNTHVTFQFVMTNIFQAFLCQFVLPFFDDILVCSHDYNSHKITSSMYLLSSIIIIFILIQ